MLRAVAVLVAAFLTAQPSPQITIRGRVVAAATGDPIRNARVAFDPKSDPSAVLTDADGRFVLAAVAPGRQTLHVWKTGYAAMAVPLAPDVEIRLQRGGVITGRVLDEFSEPLPLVSVAAEQVIRANGRVEFRRQPAVDTDDTGAYRIFGLPAGDFVVGLVGPRVSLGGTTSTPGPIGAGGMIRGYYPDGLFRDKAQTIAVHPGEEVAGINLTIQNPRFFGPQIPQSSADTAAYRRTAAIEGHVVHSDGLPARRARVMLSRADRTFSAWPTVADDNGHYQFSGLAPGDYRVVATDTSFRTTEHGQRTGSDHGELITAAAGRTVDGVDVVIPRGSAVSGRIVDEYGDPIENANVRVERIGWSHGRRRLVSVTGVASRQTDDRGRFRIFGLLPGRYVIGAVVGEPVPGWETADIPGYLRTYFPGSSGAAEAQLVEVTDDADALNTEFPLVRGRASRVAGRVFLASGAPFDGTVWLNQTARSGAITNVPVRQRTRADGSFEFTRLAPGEYVIQAATSREGTSVEGEFGVTFVPVGGTDVTNATVRMSPGSSIAGRITFDGARERADPQRVEILAGRPVDLDLWSLADNPTAHMTGREDGTWELAGLNGSRRLLISGLPRGWTLDRILVDGVDMTDTPLSFGSKDESVRDVEVVLTDRVTTIQGNVHDGRDQPSTGATVVAFSSTRSLWYPETRFVRMEGTVNGDFIMSGLPPGEYFVAALEGSGTALLEDRLDDRTFLESLVVGAARVTLDGGQRVLVSLRSR